MHSETKQKNKTASFPPVSRSRHYHRRISPPGVPRQDAGVLRFRRLRHRHPARRHFVQQRERVVSQPRSVVPVRVG